MDSPKSSQTKSSAPPERPSIASTYSDMIYSECEDALTHYQDIPELDILLASSTADETIAAAFEDSDKSAASTQSEGYTEAYAESDTAISSSDDTTTKTSRNEILKPDSEGGYAEYAEYATAAVESYHSAYDQIIDDKASHSSNSEKESTDIPSAGGYSDSAYPTDQAAYKESNYATNEYSTAAYADRSTSYAEEESSLTAPSYSDKSAYADRSAYSDATEAYNANGYATAGYDEAQAASATTPGGYATNYAEASTDDSSTKAAENQSHSKAGHNSTAPAVPVIPSGRNWNLEFQNLKSLPISTKEEILSKCRAYRDLAAEFRETAIRVGRLIIDEKWLPEDKKTIKSVAVGGIAGGEKFICEGIFFKFAVDNGMYSGEENAGKAAGLELRALDAIFQNYEVLWPNGISTVPMVLIDYHGWRLIATATLPLHPASLVYGSRDAGKTVQKSNEAFNQEMEKLGARLNLKQHRVGQIDPKMIVGPVDIEGHIGSDGKWYIIDTARLMPPEAPSVRGRPGEYQRGWIWCRHLRAEALIRCPIRLNSDVYTGFNRENDPKKCRSEVDSATKWIVDRLIPAFAQRLTFEHVADFRFEQMLHDSGINIRMLGNVRHNVKTREVRRVLMEKMVARACRSVINEKLRSVRKGSTDNYFFFRETAADHLNLLIGQSDEAEMFFAATVVPRIAQKFGSYSIESKDGSFMSPSEIFSEIPSKASLLFATSGLLGIRFTDEFVTKLFAEADFFKSVAPIKPGDIVSIDARVKISSNTLGEEGFRASMNIRNLPPPTKLADEEFSDLIDHFMAIYEPSSRQLAYTLSALNGYELRDRQPDSSKALMANIWPTLSSTVASALNPYERAILECSAPQQYLMWLILQRQGNAIGDLLIQLSTLLGENHSLLSRVLIYLARVPVQQSQIKLDSFPAQTLALLRLAIANFGDPKNSPLSKYQWIELHHIFEANLYPMITRMRANLDVKLLRTQIRQIAGERSIFEAWFLLTVYYVVQAIDFGGSKWIMEPNTTLLSLVEEALPMLEEAFGPNDVRLAYCLFKIADARHRAPAPDPLGPLCRCAQLLADGLEHEAPRFKIFGAWLPTVFFHWERFIEKDFSLISEMHRQNIKILERFRGHEDSQLIEPWIEFFAQSSGFWSSCAEYHALIDSNKLEEAVLLQDKLMKDAELHEESLKAIKKHVFAWRPAFKVGEAPIFDRKNCQPLLRSPSMIRQPILLPAPVTTASSWISHFVGTYSNGSFYGTGKLSFGQFFSQLTGVVSASGHWKHGRLEGLATVVYSDGTKYEGIIKESEFNGEGTWYTSEGSFKGVFNKGKLSGTVDFTPAILGGTTTRSYRDGSRLYDEVIFSTSSSTEIEASLMQNLQEWEHEPTQFLLKCSDQEPSGVGAWLNGELIHYFIHDWSGNFVFSGRTACVSFVNFFGQVSECFRRLFKLHPSGPKLQILTEVGSAVSKALVAHFAAAGPKENFLLEYSSSKWRGNAALKIADGFGRLIDLFINIPQAAPIAVDAGLESSRRNLTKKPTRYENENIAIWKQDDFAIRKQYPEPDITLQPPREGTTIARYDLSRRGRSCVAYGYCSSLKTGRNPVSQPVHVDAWYTSPSLRVVLI